MGGPLPQKTMDRTVLNTDNKNFQFINAVFNEKGNVDLEMSIFSESKDYLEIYKSSFIR